jgi:hypothetical protein
MPNDVSEIRRIVERCFTETLKDKGKLKIEGVITDESYGHSAGTPIEEWAKRNLQRGTDFTIYYPNEALARIFKELKDPRKIESFLDAVWWGKLLFTKEQLKDFMAGKEVKRWQQEGADLVLLYDSDITKNPDKVILINVKSHLATRQSRPPNIMSAQRLLEYFDYILAKGDGRKLLSQAELWFLGVSYAIESTQGEVGGVAINKAVVSSVALRDLFKLDVEEIPQINFDAAIQIQWHVEDMKEVKQTKDTFVANLADEFIERWRHHSSAKESKYEKLIQSIKKHLS